MMMMMMAVIEVELLLELYYLRTDVSWYYSRLYYS
jgi:hypothetical protein